MQTAAFAFPEGIYVPGLKPQKSVQRLAPEIELELPELKLRELSILMQKRGRK